MQKESTGNIMEQTGKTIEGVIKITKEINASEPCRSVNRKK
jgi:hypothetical protein